MAEVFAARDRLLGATVAIKICRAAIAQEPSLRHRFEAEAQITAQLRHPGIPAVHDRGNLADGRPFFTLELIRGQTLAEAIASSRRRWPLRRLVDALARAAQALAWAHHLGIIHRDVKPDNIMLGDFGQVHLMDWGLARSIRHDDPDPEVQVTSAGHQTQVGQVVGTLAYMAPEQAEGATDLGPEADVYALGACLFEVLSGAPPYPREIREAWAARRRGPPPRLDPTRHPAPLLALIDHCGATLPTDRPAEAGAVAEALVDWLDGSSRLAQADARMVEAEAAGAELAAIESAIAQRRAEADRLLGPLQSFDPVASKLPGWEAEAEARRLEASAAGVRARRLLLYGQALQLWPEHEGAHQGLAAHHAAALLTAEENRDVDGAAQAEALLRAHDRGAFATLLRAEAWMDVLTEPAGAAVWWSRLVDRHGRFEPAPPVLLGHSPLRDQRLPAGNHLLRIERQGHTPLLIPLQVRRQERWLPGPPGEAEGFRWTLPTGLGPDDIPIAAGPTWVGGDHQALDAPPRTRLWVPAFVMRRQPVTHGEYLAFLRRRWAAGAPITDLLPLDGPGGPIYVLDADGQPHLRQDGGESHVEADWPVNLITRPAALAYAADESAQTGLPWRLPHEWEWEKAARGVDGRVMPWGDRVEPGWTNLLGSRNTVPRPVPVTSLPFDQSPYGVWGLGGNMRTWCLNRWMRRPPELNRGRLFPTADLGEGPMWVTRGGAWGSVPAYCRSANRFGSPASAAYTSTGIRLVCSLGD